MKPLHTDVVVIGAGIAGLMTALALKPLRVAVLTPCPLGQGSSTGWAQGGIAAAIGKDDSALTHAVDSAAVACGIADSTTIELVTDGAREAIDTLLAYGVAFDRDAEGNLSLTREAAHHFDRILHCGGDQTGAEVMRALIEAVKVATHIDVLEGYAATSLLAAQGKVKGVFAMTGDGAAVIHASATVLATGGTGHLYAKTTNPAFSNGDGMAMAARAGAMIADPEFVQFHPTAIDVARDPLPLASEALRGEGAWLIDETGKRFMSDIHPDAELAPRDVVARAIWTEQKKGRTTFLDAREALGPRFRSRFPSIHENCLAAGIDPELAPIPVTPAAHYHMGGVMIDLYGRTSLDGLWACGEVASSGMHGANRLASNSLLEGAVFAKRIAENIQSEAQNWQNEPLMTFGHQPQLDASTDAATMEAVRQTMYTHVALERGATGLTEALLTLNDLERATPLAAIGTRNMLTAARLITASALMREESRGSHFRIDFPETKAQGKRSLITLAEVDTLVRTLETRAA